MTEWLIDKSALVRLGVSVEPEEWAARIERGLVRIATVTLLEVGFSARSGKELQQGLEEPPLSKMPVQHLTPTIEERAVAVQRALAERGHHRAASVPDLLIAAAAELSGLTLLHVDKDFELIGAVTGQDMERLAVG